MFSCLPNKFRFDSKITQPRFNTLFFVCDELTSSMSGLFAVRPLKVNPTTTTTKIVVLGRFRNFGDEKIPRSFTFSMRNIRTDKFIFFVLVSEKKKKRFDRFKLVFAF